MAALLDALQSAAGVTASDPAEQKIQKLNTAFARLGAGAAEATALIAGLLGLPGETPSQAKELSPQKRKERVFAALLDSVQQTAARSPMLLLVEDAHWLDPTSLDFLTLLVERAAAQRLLLLMMVRPDFTPPWPDHSYVSTLTLSRLGRSDAAVLIHEVAGERPVSAALEDKILSRTEGVPLFIEELTKSMLEHRDHHADDRRSTSRGDPRDDSINGAGGWPVQTAPIPMTLHGLLLGRFDRLEGAKEIAQAAAVIGREFSFELLRSVVRLDDDALARGLDQLVSSGLAFRRGAAPEASFVFKHALVRDAAYETLLRARRQALHGAVARVYEDQFPETVATEPELLALHWREAGEMRKAVFYLLAAAERALLRSAMKEAVVQCQLALKLLSSLPEDEEIYKLELKVQIILARGLVALKGPASSEPAQAYERARSLCERVNDNVTLPLVLIGQWYASLIGAKYRNGIKQAEILLQVGKRENQHTWQTLGLYGIGQCWTMLGEFEAGRRYLSKALKLNEFELPGGAVATWGAGDARVLTLGYLQQCQFLQGLIQEAEDTERSTIACAAALSQPYARGLALNVICRMHEIQRRPDDVAKTATELLALAEDQRFLMLAAFAKVHLGWAMALSDDPIEGSTMCRDGIAVCRRAGIRFGLPLHLGVYAEALCHAEDWDGGLDAVREATKEVRETEEFFWKSELQRLEGVILSKRNEDADAETSFKEAMHTARQQGARLFELRAATSLAALLNRAKRRKEAQDTLIPIVSKFPAKFDFAELRDAKCIIESLGD